MKVVSLYEVPGCLVITTCWEERVSYGRTVGKPGFSMREWKTFRVLALRGKDDEYWHVNGPAQEALAMKKGTVLLKGNPLLLGAKVTPVYDTIMCVAAWYKSGSRKPMPPSDFGSVNLFMGR